MPKRRCLSCSTLTDKTYCTDCRRARDRERNASRPHYHGDYRARADMAKTIWHTEGAHCWLCDKPLHPERHWPDPLSTTADHERPGDPDSPLRPAHGSCNASRGNRPLT